jgi:hypothetical protein
MVVLLSRASRGKTSLFYQRRGGRGLGYSEKDPKDIRDIRDLKDRKDDFGATPRGARP